MSASEIKMLVWAAEFNFDLVTQSAAESSRTEVDYTAMCMEIRPF